MLKTADVGSQELSTQRHDTDGLKWTMVETLTPWKWANTSKQGFFLKLFLTSGELVVRCLRAHY